MTGMRESADLAANFEDFVALKKSVEDLRFQIDRFESNTASAIEQIHRHLYFEAIDRSAFMPHFRRFALEVEDSQRDLISLLIRDRVISSLDWRIITDHPIASDTVDHLFPRGTIKDNTRHPGFVVCCESILGNQLRHLDLGCAGGGLVWDFTVRQHVSVGIEGSDLSRRAQRAEWRLIPDRLFTADLRYPFAFVDQTGACQRFNLVTAWELFEHIPEEKVPTLLTSIRNNLQDDGIVVASIATFQDKDLNGHDYHPTIRDVDWWSGAFRASGLEPINSPFSVTDFPRGSGNPRTSDWNAAIEPHLGFHLVARVQSSKTRSFLVNSMINSGNKSEEFSDNGEEFGMCRRISPNCIFVMGHGRSNTTIFQQIINTSPQILIMGEAELFSQTKDGGFRSIYNEKHLNFGNQICKSTYIPDFLPQSGASYYEWMAEAAKYYQFIGDKVAFNYGTFAEYDPAIIREFYESRFFQSKYVFLLRDPIQTILSTQRLTQAEDEKLHQIAIGWIQWMQMWADMIRIFPRSITLMTDDLSEKSVEAIECFIGVGLPNASALINSEERQSHQLLDTSPLAEHASALAEIYALAEKALAGERVLLQADQKRKIERNSTHKGLFAPFQIASYPIGEMWLKAERLKEVLLKHGDRDLLG